MRNFSSINIAKNMKHEQFRLGQPIVYRLKYIGCSSYFSNELLTLYVLYRLLYFSFNILAAQKFFIRTRLCSGICYRKSVCLSVCLSSVVCLSVTFVHLIQGVEAFGNISSPMCTLAILSPPCKISPRSSQGNLPSQTIPLQPCGQ